MYRLLMMCFCLATLCSYAVEEIRDSATGESFPKEITFQANGKDYHLHCTGVATRKKLFVKIYSVAHYLQDGAQSSSADAIQHILEDDNAKQLTLKFVRDVDAAKAVKGLSEALRNSFSEGNYAMMKTDIDKFTQWFNHDVKKGEEQIFRWLPGGYLEVLINGNSVGNLANKEFAKGVWSIWFGDKSVVNRNQLISLMK